VERDVIESAQQGGELRLAAPPTIAATVLPHAVAAFRAELPDIALSLAEADPPAALPELAAGAWDLVLVYDYPVVESEPDDALEAEPLFRDDMAVCLPVGHHATTWGTVDLGDLRADTWVTPYDSICREAIEVVCRRAGFTPRVVSETNDYMAMQGLVAT